MLNDRWADVLAAEEYDLKRPVKIYPKRKPLPQFDDEAPEPIPSPHNAANRPPCGRDKAATQAEHQPTPPHRKGRDNTACGHTMTFDRTWTIEKDIPDRSTDREDVPRYVTTTIYSNVTSLVTPWPKTADGLHGSYIAMWPNIEAPHTLFASQTK